MSTRGFLPRWWTVLTIWMVPSLLHAQGTTNPAVSGLVARVTAQGVGSVTWAALQGATNYFVVRWNAADVACCKVMSAPRLASTALSWQDGTLPQSGTYVYRVYAATPTGTYVGEIQVIYTAGVASSSDPSLRSNVTAAGATGPGTSLSSGPTSTLSRPTKAAMNDGPAPTNLKVEGTVSTASLTWDAVAGATSYSVARAVAGTTSWLQLTPKPIQLPNYGDALPDPRISYTYQVTATQADGHYGVATANYTPPAPSDPTEFSASQTAEGEVLLSWKDAPGVTKYLLTGPGATAGIPVSSNTPVIGPGIPFGHSTYQLSGLPNGTHTWTIASSYQPGGILTTSDKWPKASVAVGSWSGRYRVTLLGFEVNAQTVADPFDDGLGDEVYFAAHVSTYNLSNKTWGVRGVVRSLIHGDTTRLPGRVRAGSAGTNGGLQNGDKYLLSVTGPALPATPKTTTVPMLLWEGQLTNDVDALFIAPSVWESDGNDVRFSDWSRGVQAALDPQNMFQLQKELAASGITAFRHSDGYVGSLRGPGVDHPIGIVTMGSTTATTYGQWYFALTRRKIEAALSPTSTIGQSVPGVLSVALKDLYTSDGFGGAYTVYLFVERLP